MLQMWAQYAIANESLVMTTHCKGCNINAGKPLIFNSNICLNNSTAQFEWQDKYKQNMELLPMAYIMVSINDYLMFLLENNKIIVLGCPPLHGKDQLLCPSRNSHRY